MAELVLKKIAQQDTGPKVITIPTQLVKRESCRPLIRIETAPKEELFQTVLETQ
jgi:hypothetical protein